MLSPLRRLVIAGASVLVAAACASSSASTDATGAPTNRGAGEADIVVMFANNSMHQANVYAISGGGTATRVGTIFAGRRERLRLPATLMAGTRTISFGARLLTSSQEPRSGPVTLVPGDSIEVQMASDATTLTVLPLRGGRP